MAICTKCGTILHDDDILAHTCNAANLPKKGNSLIPTTTAVLIDGV